jgi:hypothetical protein
VANPRGASRLVKIGELPVAHGRAPDRCPVGEQPQFLEAQAARREQLAIARLDIAVPEHVAQAEPGGQGEDDIDVRAPFVPRRDDGLAELDVGHRIQRVAVTDLEGRRFHPARGGEQDVGESARGRVHELDLGKELEGLERAGAAKRVAIGQKHVGPERDQGADGIGLAVEDRAVEVVRGDRARRHGRTDRPLGPPET